MTTPDQKNNDASDQQERSTPPQRTREEIPHAPGGPGWISEHAMWFWIAGFVIAISALVIYMIIDNQ